MTNCISIINDLIMLPIVWYGNEEQKKKYLPKLSSGEWMGCYSLTEPGAGSDLRSMTCRADRNGSDYVITGTKHFISHADIADFVILFSYYMIRINQFKINF